MNTWHFEITYRDGLVSVLEYQDNKILTLKNNGEESWDFSPNFWQWLKEKISYNGEPISFVIISDEGLFDHPPSSFKLADHNTCHQCITKDDSIQAYPKLSTEPEKQVVSEPPLQPKTKSGSLQGYFVGKTQKYQESK